MQHATDNAEYEVMQNACPIGNLGAGDKGFRVWGFGLRGLGLGFSAWGFRVLYRPFREARADRAGVGNKDVLSREIVEPTAGPFRGYPRPQE